MTDPPPPPPEQAPDVILSTDCVYREGIPDLLVSSIEALMGPKSIALCAVASHKPDVMKEFCDRVASSDTLTMDQVMCLARLYPI
ncbi:hypothetical protein T484DRAFT_1833865 [Baffinella frigidus]|nr:hypothetical protein T484DRAFT_1833865 [Cryptophyta sp. CCMP2293]